MRIVLFIYIVILSHTLNLKGINWEKVVTDNEMPFCLDDSVIFSLQRSNEKVFFHVTKDETLNLDFIFMAKSQIHTSKNGEQIPSKLYFTRYSEKYSSAKQESLVDFYSILFKKYGSKNCLWIGDGYMLTKNVLELTSEYEKGSNVFIKDSNETKTFNTLICNLYTMHKIESRFNSFFYQLPEGLYGYRGILKFVWSAKPIKAKSIIE